MNAATRGFGALVAALAVVAGLVSCSGVTLAPSSAPSPSTPSPSTSSQTVAPAARPTADVTVPQMNAGLDSQRQQAVPPIRLRIDALGIDMNVQPTGVDADGAMALPRNPAEAAWYRYGAWPGSASGSIVIAAHVDALEYDLGPLARLPEVEPGTEILVTTADGADRAYLVAEEGMVVKSEVPWANVFDRTGPSRLTIVTCGGEFDPERRSYLSNVIVTALPRP